MAIVERNRPTISIGIGMSETWHDAPIATITTSLARVKLRRPLAERLRAGHPWVYADALVRPRGIATGAVVDVVDGDGRFVARGLYDARSPIAVRVATLDPSQPIDADFVRARVTAALRARRGAVDFDRTSAFRWCNGEGDRLPGV